VADPGPHPWERDEGGGGAAESGERPVGQGTIRGWGHADTH
jgi:hypothetical protein